MEKVIWSNQVRERLERQKRDLFCPPLFTSASAGKEWHTVSHLCYGEEANALFVFLQVSIYKVSHDLCYDIDT